MANATDNVNLLSQSTIQLLLGSLVRDLSHVAANDSIHGAGAAVVSIIAARPLTSVNLAHHKLHVFPFKNVPLCWRRVHEEGSLWQILKILEGIHLSCHGGTTDCEEKSRNWMDHCGEEGQPASEDEEDVVRDIVRLCDMAIILSGAPGRRGLFDTVLASLDAGKESVNIMSYSTNHRSNSSSANDTSDTSSESSETWLNSRSAKRRRLSDIPAASDSNIAEASGTQFPSASKEAPIPCVKHPLPRFSRPSLSTFRTHMYEQATPVVIEGALGHWPALHRWRSPRYWLRRTHGGHRLVPVEVGRSYTDEGWGQKMMTFKDFMDDYLMCTKETGSGEAGPDAKTVENGTSETSNKQKPTSAERQVGYLAQHDLLAQIPALRNDIAIPDYCYINPPRPSTSHQHPQAAEEPEDPDVAEPLLNIWLGPAHTISPAHTDPHHNILAQVVGRKYVRLFAPAESAKMYPMSRSEGQVADDEGTGAESGVDMANTSRVDVGNFVDHETDVVGVGGAREEQAKEQITRFPLFATAQFVDCVLGPGDCLYIPRGWWHYVRSLEVSCSVSFWWD